MDKRTIRGRSPVSGFAITRVGSRRRMLERLRPEGGFIPLDLDLFDVVAELDPGMVAWRANSGQEEAQVAAPRVEVGVVGNRVMGL